MSGRRAPAPKKRKKSGGSEGSNGVWLLYPLAVVVGTTAGVLYHFNTLPAARSASKPASKAAARPAALEPASQPRTRRRHRTAAAEEEPAVQVRSLDDPASASTTVTGTTTPAPPATPATPLPPTEIERGAGTRPEVSLTFDAGADWRPVKAILAALEQRGAKATFFLTGEWIEKNPKTTRLIIDAGHEVGNHSWDHPAFTHLSDDAVREQLRRTETIVQETTGKSSRPYFRPPLGDRDARVRRLVGEEGFLTVYWTLDSRDSVDRGITAEQIRQRVVDKASAGSIVLLHCGSKATAEALPAVLDGLQQRGFTQVPLSRLLQE